MWRLAITIILTGGALLAVVFPLLSATAQPQAESVCADGKIANLDLTLQDVNGKDVALSKFKGSVILFDFWATWCAPCKAEIPDLIELYNKHKSQGFVIVGITMGESLKGVKAFAKRLKVNYPVLIGAGQDDLNNLEAALGPIVRLPPQSSSIAPGESV